MSAALSLWKRLRTAGSRENRIPDLLAILAFAVATASFLACMAGLRAFTERNPNAGYSNLSESAMEGELYVTLAWIATTCMIIPILTLGGTAARLAIARRDARLAALRLAGATSGQVTVMTLAEAAVQALTGAIAGVALYAATLPIWTRVSFQGKALTMEEMILPIWQIGLVVIGVVLVAIISGISSLARVAISPLGVAARTTPRSLSAVRLLAAVLACVAWFAVIQPMTEPDRTLIVLFLAAVILAVNAVGPFVVMLAGKTVARFAPNSTMLLAARRIVDDPKSTWRAVGALGLAILVAGFTTLAGGAESGRDGRPADVLSLDIQTGAMITLAIITVIAATSTGVVQAARVLDQRAAYRSLWLAGTERTTLHRARALEIAVPLTATVMLTAGFVLALMLPFASFLNLTLVARFVAATGIACAVMMLSVLASRSLVRQATAV